MRWKLTETNTDWEDLVLLRIAELSHEYLDSIMLPLPRLPFNAHRTCKIAGQITRKTHKKTHNKSHQVMAQCRKGIRETTRNPRL
jgi:hypothetical protein